MALEGMVALRAASGVLVALALGALVLSLDDLGRALAPLVSAQRPRVRFLRLKLSAEMLIGLSVGALVLGALALMVEPQLAPIFWGLPLLGEFTLRAKVKKRVERLEGQIAGFLGTLSRALEAAPSLGEALTAACEMTDAPLRDELTEMLGEVALGTPIDRALTAMGRRVGSRTFQLALLTLQVGRRTGGQLPALLRSSAASLRELARLEGVLRTKTAEGKIQALVIALVPLPLYGGVRLMDPMYFVPLETTGLGQVMLGVSVCLWMAAVLFARKILAVQL